jgi:hypothetical protein
LDDSLAVYEAPTLASPTGSAIIAHAARVMRSAGSSTIGLCGETKVFTDAYGIFARQLLFRSVLCAVYNVDIGRPFIKNQA